MDRTLLLFLLEVTAKATAIVGVTTLVCWLLRRRSAALRHFIWAIALAGVLALPALALLVPDWHVAVLPAAPPAEAMASGQAQTSPGLDAARDVDSAVPIFEARPPRARSAAPQRSEAAATPLDSSRRTEPAARVPDRQMPDRPFANLTVLLLTLWIAGALVALGRLVAGHAHLWWMARRADPIADPAWLELARQVADQLRLAAPNGGGTARLPAIRLLRSRRPTMPVCWGMRRPSLLLPSDADWWTVERRRIVLLHELAHAKRGDCVTQALAQMAIAMHWFNPLVWLAARHLRAERERACDDLVLACGASAPDYADHLLDIARAFWTAGCHSWAAVAIARPSQLEGRLLAILDRHRDRRGLTWRACAVGAMLALAMTGTLAAVQPAPSPAPATSDGRASSQAGSKSRPVPTRDDRSEPRTAVVVAGDVQPVPLPLPRPTIAPAIDPPDPVELEDLELEIDGLIEGVGADVGVGVGIGIPGGIKGGVVGGVPGGVPPIDPIEIESMAADVPIPPPVDTDVIAVEVAERAIAKIAGVDDRPEADPRIVAALATALKDQSADVRRQAASTLAQLRSPQALDALTAATTDADKGVRAFAVQAISRHRSDAVTQALVRALKDADAGVRHAAIHGVARLRDPQYIDVLTAALKDANPELRGAAANGLAAMRDVRAVPGLITALQDGNATVRQQAAYALGPIGDIRAVDSLVAALADTDGEVRAAVVHALGQIGRRGRARARE